MGRFFIIKKFIDFCFDQDRSKQLQDGVTKIIINSQVSTEGQSEDLKALAKLMNNKPVKLNKHFDYLNNGRTLEQATEFVRNLKLISDKELEKVVAMYK